MKKKLFSFLIVCSVLSCSLKENQGPLRVKGVIFDCDGVLVNSMALRFKGWQETFQEYGLEFNEEKYKTLFGTEVHRVVSEMVKYNAQKNPPAIPTQELKAEEVIAKKEAAYLKFLQQEGVPPMERMISFVKKLISQKEHLGIKLAVASAAKKEEILSNLEAVSLDSSSFDVILSGEEDLAHIDLPKGKKNKPEPYIYQEMAKQLKLNPQDCIVFEDSRAGVQAAYKAGMKVYAVPNEYTQLQDFSEFDHDPRVTFLQIDYSLENNLQDLLEKKKNSF